MLPLTRGFLVIPIHTQRAPLGKSAAGGQVYVLSPVGLFWPFGAFCSMAHRMGVSRAVQNRQCGAAFDCPAAVAAPSKMGQKMVKLDTVRAPDLPAGGTLAKRRPLCVDGDYEKTACE